MASKRGLTRVQSVQKRQDIMVYDLEWYPGRAIPGEAPKKLRNNLRLVGMYDGERYQHFDNLDTFFNEIFTCKNSGKWIFAHYGGMADMQFVLRHIVEKKGDYEVSASFSGSSAIIVKVKRASNEWTFIDSFWLLRDKLAKLGKAVGRKKLSDAYECSNFPACGHLDPLDEEYRQAGNGSCSHFSKHSFEDVHGELICQYCGEQRPKSLCTFFAPMGHLITYNEQDCIILYEAIRQFEETLLSLGGELQMTIASCAMRLFRRKYLTGDIKNKAMGMSTINDIARQAYTSSRVEVFQKECPSDAYVESLYKKGLQQCAFRCFEQWKAARFPYAEFYPFLENRRYEGFEGKPLCPTCVQFASHNRAHYYDLNSSFPFAMTFPAPGNFKRRREKSLPKKSDSIYLADVEVTVPEMYLPPLPYRHQSRVFFPFGTWRAWMSNVDMELLLEKGGRVNKVFESIEFESQSYLRDYAIDIYERRKNATSDYEKLVLKYLLNSLYGKFGERPEKTSMLLYPDNTHCPHEPKHRCKDFPYCDHAAKGEECDLCMQLLWPGCFLVTHEGEVAHEWVPIGVHITAIARKNLYNHLWDAQGDIYYCDSMTKDRTIILLSPDKRTHVLPVEKAWNLVGGEIIHAREKEFKAPQGWKTLAADAKGRQGWFPLQQMVRHATNKELWKVSNKDGQTEVTTDHGIMHGFDTAMRPEAFVQETNAEFTKLRAMPPSRTMDGLDLWEMLEGAEWRTPWRRKNNIMREIVRKFVLLDEETIGFDGYGECAYTFRRFYERDSVEMFALLRLLAAYISEGSASINGITTSRSMFAISNKTKSWLEGLMTDFAHVTTCKPALMDVGNGMWAIRSGTAAISYFFGHIGGIKSEGKKIAPFLYDLTEREFDIFWKTIVEGDGNVRPTGSIAYSSKSQELIAGLSYMLDQRGIEHTFQARTDKIHWTIVTRPAGSGRNRRKTTVVKRKAEGEYVYDLTVQGAHTFVDGMGRVLVHNTDSVITTSELPSDPKTLGALKLEEDLWGGEFVAPKVYAAKVAEADNKARIGEDIVKAKGFSRMTYKKFVEIKEGERVKIARMTRLRELYRRGETEPEEAVVEKRLVQKLLPKRCALESGNTRPWAVHEIQSDRKDASISIEVGQRPAMPEPGRPRRRSR